MRSTSPSSTFAACILVCATLTAIWHYTRTADAVGSLPAAGGISSGAHDFSHLPMSFERNVGQLPPEVKYVGRGLGYTTYLTGNEVSLVFAAPLPKPDLTSPAGSKLPDATADDQVQVVSISLDGGNASPVIDGAERLPGDVNYFIGSDSSKWKTGVPTFGRVNYEEVYPGIDLTYYGNQGQLEFDFTVAPGTDPDIISLSYKGVESFESAEGGALTLKTALGDVRQAAPVIYQEQDGRRVRVEGEYVLRADRSVGFRVHDYDRARPLVIDPVIQYSTLLGGTSDETAFGLAVDSAGNAYITGTTFSTNFPTVNPVQGIAAGGGRDVFVTKINPSGNAILYSTYLGGSADEHGLDIVLNPSGEAYVAGWTRSTNFPLAAPFQNVNRGGVDAFLARLSPAGNTLVYSTYAGGQGEDVAHGVALDASGNIYAIGYTLSPDLQLVNPLQPSKGAGRDVYLVKTNPAGSSIIFSTYLGGAGNDTGRQLAVDGSGNVYGIGYTSSPDLPTVDAVQSSYSGSFDAYIAKISADGRTLLYGTYLGGPGDDSGEAIALDSSNNIYVTGYTDTLMNVPAVNALQPFKRAGYDAFFAKIAAESKSIIYLSYLGGDDDDFTVDMVLDSVGRLFLTGWTYSANFPTSSPVQGAIGGGERRLSERDRKLRRLARLFHLSGRS